MSLFVLAALLAAAPAAPSSPCLDATMARDVAVTLTGRLERHVYPGPPNYGEGPHDSREPAYILIPDRPLCLREDTVIPARAPFRRVHLYPGRGTGWPQLRAAAGHRVRISGRGSGAVTAHDRAPLIVDVASLRILR